MRALEVMAAQARIAREGTTIYYAPDVVGEYGQLTTPKHTEDALRITVSSRRGDAMDRMQTILARSERYETMRLVEDTLLGVQVWVHPMDVGLLNSRLGSLHSSYERVFDFNVGLWFRKEEYGFRVVNRVLYHDWPEFIPKDNGDMFARSLPYGQYTGGRFEGQVFDSMEDVDREIKAAPHKGLDETPVRRHNAL